MVCGSITRLEIKITKLEEKEMLTEKEQQSVSKMVKRLDALSTEFKTYQCTIVDQTEDQEKLAKEQVVLDNHEDKVEELMKLTVLGVFLCFERNALLSSLLDSFIT